MQKGVDCWYSPGYSQFKLWSCAADWALPASLVPWLCDYFIAYGVMFVYFYGFQFSAPATVCCRGSVYFPVSHGWAVLTLSMAWEAACMNFIQMNNAPVAGRAVWEETAKNWFILHIGLKMVLITSAYWVWPCQIEVWIKFTRSDTNVKYLVWEKLLLLFLAAARVCNPLKQGSATSVYWFGAASPSLFPSLPIGQLKPNHRSSAAVSSNDASAWDFLAKIHSIFI